MFQIYVSQALSRVYEQGTLGDDDFDDDDVEITPANGNKRQVSYFWDWVMVAALPTAILLALVLLLSVVFFGQREGQHWRDYKTPQ